MSNDKAVKTGNISNLVAVIVTIVALFFMAIGLVLGFFYGKEQSPTKTESAEEACLKYFMLTISNSHDSIKVEGDQCTFTLSREEVESLQALRDKLAQATCLKTFMLQELEDPNSVVSYEIIKSNVERCSELAVSDEQQIQNNANHVIAEPSIEENIPEENLINVWEEKPASEDSLRIAAKDSCLKGHLQALADQKIKVISEFDVASFAKRCAEEAILKRQEAVLNE